MDSDFKRRLVKGEVMPRDSKDLDLLGVLADPIRRELYTRVITPGREISREEAARILGISRSLAAHHLDRLAEAGLLEFSFRRPPGKTGPGSGRPTKLYRRSAMEVDLTFPPRRYELAAQLLAQATATGGPTHTAALDRAAEEWGRRLGAEARERIEAQGGADHPDADGDPDADGHPNAVQISRAIMTALRATGFEPRHEGNTILLENCPFAGIQREVPLLTCGMNYALCRGILEGLEAKQWTARLEPRPGRCCVVFERRATEDTLLTA
jgi:predicted ArsR family transcriptional regulator